MTPGRRAGRRSPASASSSSSSWPVKHTASYGGVVVRSTPNGPEVALIRPRADDGKEVWALPKGAKDDDETPEQAALREVREETGLEADVVQALEPITYWFAWAPEQVRYRKTVRYFLMRHAGGDPKPDGFEVADVSFVPVSAAARKATYPSEKKVLKTVAELTRDW